MSGCVICKNPLEVEIERDEDEEYEGGASSSGKAPAPAPETVPDDVQLSCGCHFHWDCLLSAYEITSCPNCSKEISVTEDNTQKVLCRLNNEGGVQENLDILPLLVEESYLKAYPEDRKARAFLEFCRAGDYKAIIELLLDDSSDDDDEDEQGDVEMSTTDDPEKETGIDRVLRYQDPIGDMQSGLHAAVHAQSREVAWLLLLLASNYPLLEFPPEVFQEASSVAFPLHCCSPYRQGFYSCLHHPTYLHTHTPATFKTSTTTYNQSVCPSASALALALAFGLPSDNVYTIALFRFPRPGTVERAVAFCPIASAVVIRAAIQLKFWTRPCLAPPPPSLLSAPLPLVNPRCTYTNTTHNGVHTQ